MNYFKTEVDGSASHVQTINLAYPGETYAQIPVMVEFRAVPAATMYDDQKFQLFNVNQVHFVPHEQMEHATPRYGMVCAQTQTPDDMFKEGAEGHASYASTVVKKEKPYACHVCGKKYTNEKALKKHQIVHPEIVFEWQCRICDKTFPYKKTMSKHVKLHAGEKLFSCGNCSKRFETRYALLQHVKIHRSDAPFRCDQCDKPFLKNVDFSRHIRTHTGEKPFACTLCNKSFTAKTNFIKHSEKKHNLIL